MNSRKRSRQRQVLEDAHKGNADQVAEAIRCGVDVDSRDSEHGETALMFALTRNRDTVVEILLQAGADVNARDQRLFTPLVFAHGLAVERLIRAGADVNARDDEGRTVLMRALTDADFDKCVVLIDNGADVSLQDDDGNTALTVATDYGYVEMQRLL